MQAALNYEEILSGKPAIPPRAQYTHAQYIIHTEREAVLCQSLHSCGASAAKAAARSRQPLVVGVVGEAHVEGIGKLWEHGKWQSILDEAEIAAKKGEPPMKTNTEIAHQVNDNLT